MKKQKAIIIDIDNTISDAKERVDKLGVMLRGGTYPKKHIYDGFYNYAKNDKPLVDNILKIVEKYFSLSLKYGKIEIIYLTGRPERIRFDTKKWLDQNIGSVETIELIMREDNDHSEDYIYKKRELNKLKEKYEILAVWDDRQHNIDMFREQLPTAEIFKV